MRKFTYTITDPVGIHARPAGQLVKKAREYTSTVIVEKDGKRANALQLMALMGLGVKMGNEVTIYIEGADENTEAEDLENWLKEHM